MSDSPSSPERIGREAMEFTDALREHFGPDVEVGTILIAADVIVDGNPVAVSCSDGRTWVQLALAQEVLAHLEERNSERFPERVSEEDDDD